MIEDFSDVITELASGTYTVLRSGPPSRVGGRVFPSVFEPLVWAPATAYGLGDRRKNGANVYTVTTAGVSAGAGGPTGTGAAIVDGAVMWKYSGPAATQLVITASVQPLSGRELDRLPEGLRTREVQSLFTTTELHGASDSREADQVTVDGAQWQVHSAASWRSLGNFYKALITLIGR